MKYKKQIGIFEMVLLISFSFAFSFIIGESFGARVSAAGELDAGSNFLAGGDATGMPPQAFAEFSPGGASAVPSATAAGPATPTTTTQFFSLTNPQSLDVVGSGSGAGASQVGAGSGAFDSSLGLGSGGSGASAAASTGGTGITNAITTADAATAAGIKTTLAEGTTVVTKDGAFMVVKDGVLSNPATNLGEGSKFALGGQQMVVQNGNAVLASGVQSTAGQLTTGGVYAGGKGTLGSLLTGNTFGGAGSLGGAVFSSLLSGAIWGAAVGGIAYLLAGMFGLNKDQAASIGMGAGFGTFAGTTTYFLAQNGVLGAGLQASGGALLGLGIGIGVGAAIIIMTYKKQKKELVKFECLAWEAPRGGANCERCNGNKFMPCSEYRCKSLGAGCELINQGTKEETCFWVHKGDTAAPHIEPWADALSPNGLSYIPDRSISPPNRGFKIVDSEGDDCLPAFTNLQFGVIADEPAQCKIDVTPAATYDEMAYLFGESTIYSKEHTQKLKVPSPFNEEGNVSIVPEIHNDGTYTLWVRCIDPNGNGQDSALVAFRYCVDKGPDTTQPVIVSSSIRSGSPVQFDVDNVPIEVYVNEPAECRWSRQDKEFEYMENTMDCATESYQINADLNYVCSAQLTGIENRADNWFYFRCMDYSTAPGGRNVMETSYPLLLKGTQPLIITKVGPTGDFVGSASVATVTLSAETDDGSDEGVATCFFDTSPDGTFDIAMENTDSYVHNQSLDLTTGVYRYYFRCIDAGGNRAETNTTFSVLIDSTLPGVTRVFRDGEVLKVITDEEAKCYYSESTCNYDLADGLPMIYEDPTDRTVHTVDWKEDITYYIKCEDLMGNQPRPDFCQIIAQASDL